ncbi:glycosyltransferase family 2 protein [Aureitalea marina]|uniref:Glycosyl transferase n=1 Tax=Aureitalea marina TaxID=930804 RepID=A0A2S7KR74_9FLAO|nr:glycosyltransferase family 2 protein [Aureitalea marina]PQB05088.1 glycosyl transferase [Aureitalea marina]
MELLKITFWVLFFIVFYTYIGYGLVLYVLVRIKRLFVGKTSAGADPSYEPEVTLLIPAYNERDYIDQKIKNSMAQDYPADKLKICFVTDGSDDGTPELARQYPGVAVYHSPKRKGKINAMNRVMPLVESPIVIFSDANTLLGEQSIRRIVNRFTDATVGCVSGEKRIISKEKDTAAGAGEGLYWKYESTLKKWDAELNSVVGAAGELFAIRTELYQEVEPDTILDDFIISLRVAQQGYTIQYDPKAFAIETASANVQEELKRKIRISAGGIQSVVRLRTLLNIFKYKTLSFQYISHRVLRWTLTPLCLILMIPVLSRIALDEGLLSNSLYTVLFWGQLMFYLGALVGLILENRSLRIKVLFVPYYFLMMNYSVVMGFSRYLSANQSVNWERAQRAA